MDRVYGESSFRAAQYQQQLLTTTKRRKKAISKLSHVRIAQNIFTETLMSIFIEMKHKKMCFISITGCIPRLCRLTRASRQATYGFELSNA